MKNYNFFKESLPGFLFNDKIFNQTILAIGNQLDSLDADTEDLLRQLFPQTCTWSITFWEELCGINNEDKPLEIRRAKVISKLSQVSPITIKKVENIVQNFVKDSYVENIPKQYVFRLNLNGEFNFNLQQLREVIEDIKPAHLAYVIRYFIVYILSNAIATTAAINTSICFNNSVYNIPINLLLNGEYVLDGQYYLSGSARPDGIKKYFLFITEKIFKYIYQINFSNKINTKITFNNANLFDDKCIVNSIVSFHNSMYSIPTHLNLNGTYKLNGLTFLNGSTRSSGIKKSFYSTVNTIFRNDITANNIASLKVELATKNNIKTISNYIGGNFRFKSLNGKYNLDGQIDLSNKTEFLQEV
ncbi:putative phage tail protein [Clostridium botulinum]|uniref:putative phage tail protein n=1 Tax=Clostridium botulinum TaxID=1491 RepID=UPI00249F6D24|nr:putative phage tail protein [Clostridium botulinum]MDU4596433.1 putative phage tail protein [Clostridium sporogenes]WGZ48071.1 YmfQ family protein [Clostridium botulinum]